MYSEISLARYATDEDVDADDTSSEGGRYPCYFLIFEPCTRPLTNPAHSRHNPAPSVIINISCHDGKDAVTAVTCGMRLKSAATSGLLRGLLALDVD